MSAARGASLRSKPQLRRLCQGAGCGARSRGRPSPSQGSSCTPSAARPGMFFCRHPFTRLSPLRAAYRAAAAFIPPTPALPASSGGIGRLIHLWRAATPVEPNFQPLASYTIPAVESVFDEHPRLRDKKMRFSTFASAAFDAPSAAASTSAGVYVGNESGDSRVSTPEYFGVTAAPEGSSWGARAVAVLLSSRGVKQHEVALPVAVAAPMTAAPPTARSRPPSASVARNAANTIQTPAVYRTPYDAHPPPRLLERTAAECRIAAMAVSLAPPTARPCSACHQRIEATARKLRQYTGACNGAWAEMRDVALANRQAASRHREALHGGTTFRTVVETPNWIRTQALDVKRRMRPQSAHC